MSLAVVQLSPTTHPPPTPVAKDTRYKDGALVIVLVIFLPINFNITNKPTQHELNFGFDDRESYYFINSCINPDLGKGRNFM